MAKSVSSALSQTANPLRIRFSPLVRDPKPHIGRWYVMVYPTKQPGQDEELDRELARRRRNNEPLFEYFAPVLVEARKMNGRLVTTRRSLLYNYLFVHASECEIYRIKQRLPQYNLLPRVKDSKESYHYPYLTDKAMRDLQWIARSYAEPVPVCTADPAWLVKGDRIRITEGRFAGIEAKVVTNATSRHKEILVSIDNWMCVPLLKVQPGEYEVVELNAETPSYYSRLNNSKLLDRLHDALCRHWAGTGSAEDRRMATEVLQEYGSLTLDSDIMRSKLYALLLQTYTILGETSKRESQLVAIQKMLPAVRAEQSRALLLVTLYGCTDSRLYYDQAHALIDPWLAEKSPKKSKAQLIRHLADFDRQFGHGGEGGMDSRSEQAVFGLRISNK